MNATHPANRSVTVESRRPAVRLCIGADIERYRRFNNVEAARAQERFTEVLRRARQQAGLTESEVDIEPSGDGQFSVLPPGLDESTAIPAFMTGLSIALRYTNADLNAHARLRLRFAMHRGLLKPGPNGWVGNSAIAVNRFLESTPLRAALTREPTADFGIMVSDTLFRDVIAHGHPGMTPELFYEVSVDLPAKGFTEQAWVYVDCQAR